MTIPRGTAVAELENVVAEVGGESAVPPGSMGVVVVSDDKEAGEPTALHRQRLWELVEQSEQCLSQGEKEQLFALLLEYHDLFATGPQDLGQTGRVQHTINTGAAPPIRQQVRRVPQFRRQEAKRLLDDMLGRGVIQPSDSPWASPVVLVPKDCEKTAFCIPEGLFEFRVMPFGL